MKPKHVPTPESEHNSMKAIENSADDEWNGILPGHRHHKLREGRPRPSVSDEEKNKDNKTSP